MIQMYRGSSLIKIYMRVVLIVLVSCFAIIPLSMNVYASPNDEKDEALAIAFNHSFNREFNVPSNGDMFWVTFDTPATSGFTTFRLDKVDGDFPVRADLRTSNGDIVTSLYASPNEGNETYLRLESNTQYYISFVRTKYMPNGMGADEEPPSVIGFALLFSEDDITSKNLQLGKTTTGRIDCAALDEDEFVFKTDKAGNYSVRIQDNREQGEYLRINFEQEYLIDTKPGDDCSITLYSLKANTTYRLKAGIQSIRIQEITEYGYRVEPIKGNGAYSLTVSRIDEPDTSTESTSKPNETSKPSGETSTPENTTSAVETEKPTTSQNPATESSRDSDKNTDTTVNTPATNETSTGSTPDNSADTSSEGVESSSGDDKNDENGGFKIWLIPVILIGVGIVSFGIFNYVKAFRQSR